MILQAIGNHYHGYRLAVADTTPSGLYLGDQPPATELLVGSAGPGRVLDNGRHYPMQARLGDRIIAPPHALRELPGDELIVRDEDLVALRRGPEHDVLEAANDWVLVRPDPLRRVEETAGGILKSIQPLLGGEARELQRGEELYREFLARGERLKRIVAHPEERVAAQEQAVRRLTGTEREALRKAFERRGETDFQFLKPVSSGEYPHTGEIVEIGPGKVLADGFRDLRPHLSWSGSQWGEPSFAGFLWGERVTWDPSGEAVEVGDLLAVRAASLCAVEVRELAEVA